MRRLDAHGLIAKGPCTQSRHLTTYGRSVKGTTMHLPVLHFPSICAGAVH